MVAKAIRMRAAGWLLINSEKSVSAVATACGFSDSSHLGREFRKAWGVTPRGYRAARAENAALLPGAAADYQEIYPVRKEFF